MVVVLNKVDQLPEEGRSKVISKAKKRLSQTLNATKFAGCAMVPTAVRPGEHPLSSNPYDPHDPLPLRGPHPILPWTKAVPHARQTHSTKCQTSAYSHSLPTPFGASIQQGCVLDPLSFPHCCSTSTPVRQSVMTEASQRQMDKFNGVNSRAQDKLLCNASCPLGMCQKTANLPLLSSAGTAEAPEQTQGIQELIQEIVIRVSAQPPPPTGPFKFAIDHCFAIRGQGTVLTGTALSGTAKVGDSIELPELKVTVMPPHTFCSLL